jgi:hypothetical protein
MNDSTEQMHFIAKVKAVLRGSPQGPGWLHIQNLIENFDWMSLTAYSCCFSKEGDIRTQWDDYADDGAGFAVGFSTDWLRQQRRKYLPKHLIKVLEVEYDDARQFALARTCIHRCSKKVRGLNYYGRRDVEMRTIISLWVLSAACKSHSYRDEQEARLILVELTNPKSEVEASRKAVGVSPISYRQNGTQRIPYFTFPFSEDAIAEIHLGPTNGQRGDRSALEKFLKTNGYDCDRIRIEPPQVPYR